MLTIERMYALAAGVARRVPSLPLCDRDDLVQCAVIGMLEAGVSSEALGVVIARRRIIDELRRQYGRSRGDDADSTPARDATYLYQPVSGKSHARLVDRIADQSDRIDHLEHRLDAAHEAPLLLKAVGRRAKQILLWHVVQERSLAEIALRTGVTESRISQLMSAARSRARAFHEARHNESSPPSKPAREPRQDANHLEATAAEKRAFAEFRRLQRAGLRQPQAMSMLSQLQQELVAAYQRKCQRRARARAAGHVEGAAAKQPPRSQRRYETADDVVVTDEERHAAGALWTMRSKGLDHTDALGALPPVERARAESYQVKMRTRARLRARAVPA